MKYLKYIYILSFMFSLMSCDVLVKIGLEPTTVKGNWVSEAIKEELHYLIQIKDDDKYVLEIMTADSIHKLSSGTWTCKEDTISLYSQKGTATLIVKQISMNTMTVQRKKDKENIIFSRIYNNSDSSDEFSKFSEVLDLKGGFWFLIYLAFLSIFGIFFIISIVACLIEVVKWLVSKIKKTP